MKRFGFLFLLLLAGTVHARLEVTVTGGTEGALPIAIVPFAADGVRPPGEDIAAIVAADLARSGRFAPLPVETLPARPSEGAQVDFATWRTSGSDTLVVGKVSGAEGRYKVQFQLFDVLRGTQLVGYVMQTRSPFLRRTAHQIADIIYEKLTGEPGAFNTHIAYVTAEQTTADERRFRLAVADSDGYNEQVVLTSTQPLMSPAWSPDGKRLAYVSFEANRPMVYVQEVATGQREKVAEFPGINSAPAWAPDGRRLALTLSKDGDPEIYILDVGRRELNRITRHWAIDTEPAWMPDGRSLVFTSDRGGRPQLYQVEIGARGAVGPPKRITFEGSYNARAAVSPDGTRIAMVHQSERGFQIAVLDRDTDNLRVLTDTRLDESPSFAPNGRMILYATERGGQGVLEAVSVDGRAHQRLGQSGADVREPAWSPFFEK